MIIDFSGGRAVLASLESVVRAWRGSLVEVRRSRREKKLERRHMGAKRTGSMSPNPPLEMGRQLWAQVSVVRHFWSDVAKRLAHRVGKSNRRVGGSARRR